MGSDHSVPVFTSHPEPELGEATAKGRKAEFAAHGWNSDDIPDPQDPQTFLRSKLDWDERDDETRARVLACYRDLLALRRKRIEITDPWLGHLHVDYDEDGQWITLRRGALQIVCNLGTDAASVPAGGTPILWWIRRHRTRPRPQPPCRGTRSSYSKAD